MKALCQWIDDRTGLVSLWRQHQQATLCRDPRGLGVWPSMIVFTFVTLLITGFFMWTFYSTSAQSAWESIYYMQHQVAGGWFVRGLHYHAGQVLLGVIGLYLLWMIFSGGYRAPRELVFWAAVGMGVMTIALLLTGDLLTWTQRGYWSTDVRTKFLFLLPWIGESLYKLAVGGSGMGHLTLTRFLALHVGLFTVLLGALIAIHFWLERRARAIDAARTGQPPAPLAFSPISAAACLGVLAVIVVMTLATSGAELGAPRDPGNAYAAARPDWYFVGLYQFAHFFSGAQKIIPIFIVPGLLVACFLAMPLLARSTALHALNMLVTVGLLVAIGMLTVAAQKADRDDPAYQASLAAAIEDEQRVEELIQGKGIPATGALTLLWKDAKTQGPKLFQQHCASCHDCADAEGKGILAAKPTAPNLHDFAGAEWLAGFFDKKQLVAAPEAAELSPTNRPKYFGTTKFKNGKMIKFLKEDLPGMKKDMDDGEKAFQELLAALAAEAHRQPGTKPAPETLERFEEFSCTSSGCHSFYTQGKIGESVDLTGYGSRGWLIGIIRDPTHPRFYGKMNDRMPAYAKSEQPADNVLSNEQVEMLAEWLRGQWYQPAQKSLAVE